MWRVIDRGRFGLVVTTTTGLHRRLGRVWSDETIPWPAIVGVRYEPRGFGPDVVVLVTIDRPYRWRVLGDAPGMVDDLRTRAGLYRQP